MKMIKNSLLLMVLACICTSCGDFLEPKSQSEYIPRNVSAINEMLIGDAYSLPNKGLNGSLYLLDDDVACNPNATGYGSYSDPPRVEGSRYLFTWQPDQYEKMTEFKVSFNAWARYYELILGANAALDYVDDVDGTNEEKIFVKAQAYTLRGLYYFYLVNIFGEPYNYNKKALGVPLKLNSGMEETYLKRNTVEEVYNQILSDLDEAEKCYLSLPLNMRVVNGLRTNLPMVQLLKSRVYLYMENWKQAVIYADHVIKDWGLLLTDLNNVRRTSTSNYYKFISLDCTECIWMFGSLSGDIGANFPSSVETNLSRTQPFYVVSPELLVGYKSGDLRRSEYIMSHYSGVDIPMSKVYNSAMPTTTDVFSQGLRLPEAYLNLAEAAAMDKDETTALWALNKLRENRFETGKFREITDVVAGSDLIDTIRQERRLELCFELHRWFDLRRYGMPSITKTWNLGGSFQQYVLEEKDKGYTLPIPQVVLDDNKYLIQNELAPKRNPKN